MGDSVTLGNLLYFIKAKNDEFKRVVTETEDKLDGMKKKFDDNSKKMKIIGTAITGISAGVVYGLQKMTASSAASVEELEKMSIQTGISTDKLSKLGYAAKLNKSSLEGLSTGLNFLSRNMRASDLAAQDTKDAFNQLGIEIKNKDGTFRAVDDVLMDIVDRFSKMKDGAEKTALAMKIFGRGGAELVPVLSIGREEFERLGQEAERLGIVLTKDNIAAFAKYKDSLEAVETGLQGVKMQISAEVLPVMQDGIGMLKRILEWLNQLPEPTKKAISNFVLLAATIGMVAGPIMILIGFWSKLKTLVEATNLAAVFRAWAGGAVTASTAMRGLMFSFQPFLVGGAVIIGLMAIFDILNRLAESAKYASMQIANVSDAGELAKAKTEAENSLHFLEQKRKYADKMARLNGDELNPTKGFYSQDWTQQNEADLQAARARLRGIEKRLEDISNPYDSGGAGGGGSFDLDGYLKNLKVSLDAVDQEAQLFGGDIDVTSKKMDLLKSAVVELIKNGISPNSAAIQNLMRQYQSLLNEQQKELDRQGDIQAATDAEAEAWRKRQEQINANIKAQQEFYAMMERSIVMQANSQREAANANAGPSVTDLDLWYDALNQSMKDWDNWGLHLQDVAEATAQGMQQSFSDLFFDAYKGKLDSLRDYIERFLDSIVRAWSDAMSKMLTNQFLSWISSFWPIPGGAGPAGVGAAGIGATAGAAVGFRAAGGPVSAGHPYMVGERGPEPFIPSSNGTIIPNNQIGGANVQVNVINQTSQPVTAEKQSPQFDGDQYVVNVILKDVAQNGPIGRLLRK